MKELADRVVVVGASAGGVQALTDFVKPLDKSLPLAIFVVLHVSPTAASALPAILSRAGSLPATHAIDGESIEKGHIYIAPPDHHLEIGSETIALTRGPKENSSRPAIDTLFRSAASSWGTKATAIVLSGSLDDGSAGALAIEEAGGLVLIQDPEQALFSDMPQAAMHSLRTKNSHSIESMASQINAMVVLIATSAAEVVNGVAGQPVEK